MATDTHEWVREDFAALRADMRRAIRQHTYFNIWMILNATIIFWAIIQNARGS